MTQNAFEPVSMTLFETDKARFAEELGRCFREYGFAAISDHGLDEDLIARVQSASERFFALPEETKRKYAVEGGGGARGYTPYKTEIAKGADHVDLKEFWHVGRDLPEGHPYNEVMAPNLNPDEIEGWRDTMSEMFAAFDALGAKVLEAIALDLDLKPDFFVDTVRDGNSVMRLLHYPPQQGGEAASDAAEGSIRAEAHEDINTITLLLGADEPGLQVKTRTGEWIDMNPPAGCLAVNMGDMLQRSSNHVLPSTTHRVINPADARRDQSRYSMPFFLHYRPDYMIETLPGCASEENPDRYPEPMAAQDYLIKRLREIGLLKDEPEKA
jgi:isopenicillin N synthase-like dioxygenase